MAEGELVLRRAMPLSPTEQRRLRMTAFDAVGALVEKGGTHR
jgi:hypothetical protein